MITGAVISAAIALLERAGPDRHQLWRRWWWLWAGLLVLGILLIRIVAGLGESRRRALQGGGRAKKRAALRSAWEEAGRRAEPIGDDAEPGTSDDEGGEP